MKKIVLILACLVSLFAVACEKNEGLHPHNGVYTKENLPAAARDFIDTYWAQDTICSIVKDDRDYDVYLCNGTHIEFDAKGNWEDVENPKGIVTTFLPAALTQYVSKTYASAFIVSVSKDRQKYDVELSNHLDLDFDLQGNFLRLDD